MAKKYNWERIKLLYVEGVSNSKGKIVFLNLRELAKKYKISYMYLRQRAAQENWTKQRDNYRRKLEYAIKRESTKVLASETVKFDSKALELAKAGLASIKTYFLNHKKSVLKAQKEGLRIPLLNHKILDTLSKALVSFQRVGKLALERELPPERSQDKALQEFLEKEKLLTPKQKKRFFKVALKFEKELIEKEQEYKA